MRVRWCDYTGGYHHAPNGDTLDLRCEFYLDDGTVARVAVQIMPLGHSRLGPQAG